MSIVPGIMASQPLPGLVFLPLDPPITRQIAIIEHDARLPNSVVEKVRSALLQCRGAGSPAALPMRPKTTAGDARPVLGSDTARRGK